MVKRLRMWSKDTAWMELAFGFVAILWGGGHLAQGEMLGHTFGAVQRLFTAEQVEWAFLIVGFGQVLAVLYGSRRNRALVSLPAFVINSEVVWSVILSGTLPYAAAAFFLGGVMVNSISVVRNLYSQTV